MANVMFKRGLHSALPKTGIVDGAFYLTTDTNRLYVGQGDALVELNKSITTVATQADLPKSNVAEGQFYFVSENNILCWYGQGYDSTTQTMKTQWWQINGDTTLTANDAAVEVGYTSGTKTATVTTEFEDTRGNTVKGTFGITGVDGTTVTKDGNIIKIESHDTQTSLKTAADATKGVLESYEDNTKKSTINFVGGKNVTVSSDANGTITIGSADAADMYNRDASLEFDKDGKLKFGVTDGDGTVSAEVTPTITYGNNKTAKFENGAAALDVYDKTQVDNLLRTADALIFMGVVDAKDIPAITTVQNGAVYKVGSNTTNKTGYNVGDLVIAKGTESTSTHLIVSDGEWIVIPAGDDQTITGSTTSGTHSWSVNDQSGEIVGQTLVDGGENIKLESAVNGGHITTTISHDVAGAVDSSKTVNGSTADVKQTATNDASFTAVTGITRDKNGHVVGVTTHKLEVVDTHNELVSMTVESEGGTDKTVVGGSASITTTVTGKDSDEVEGTFNLTSQTLNLTASNVNNVAAVNVDLVWGSF